MSFSLQKIHKTCSIKCNLIKSDLLLFNLFCSFATKNFFLCLLQQEEGHFQCSSWWFVSNIPFGHVILFDISFYMFLDISVKKYKQFLYKFRLLQLLNFRIDWVDFVFMFCMISKMLSKWWAPGFSVYSYDRMNDRFAQAPVSYCMHIQNIYIC